MFEPVDPLKETENDKFISSLVRNALEKTCHRKLFEAYSMKLLIPTLNEPLDNILTLSEMKSQ